MKLYEILEEETNNYNWKNLHRAQLLANIINCGLCTL